MKSINPKDINYTDVDPRYGKPMNQLLIDLGVSEAVNDLGEFTSTDGRPVHIDVEGYSQGLDDWGDTVPRLDQPIELVQPEGSTWDP